MSSHVPPLHGPQTQAAVENFTISGQTVDMRIIKALAHVKAAAAIANAAVDGSAVTPEVAEAIVAAAGEIIDGRHDDQFPVDVFQTGSGTSTNMNVNEVIASLASRALGRDVHPNDEVNASQSTNDTFPTAIRLATATALRDELGPALETLERELGLKARQFATVVKAGRTHLMDASPVMLGHEFAGYRAQVNEAVERLDGLSGRLLALPVGGTATGNGLNVPEGYIARVLSELSGRTGLDVSEARDHFAAQGAQDALVEVSAQLRGLAVAMFKVANDIRWLASGPRTGLGDISLRELQPGSSIMPGKVNPVICEAVLQAAAEVMGNDATVAFAGSQGNLELNVFMPVMARNILASIDLLAASATSLAGKCVVGIEANVEACRRHADESPAVATALNLEIGYEAAARVVKDAEAQDRTIIEQVVASGLMTAERAREVLDVGRMAVGTVSPFDAPLPGEDPDIPVSAIPPADTGVVGPGTAGR